MFIKTILMDKSSMINKIIKHLNLKSDADFARHLGIKPQVLSNWKARNSFDPELIYTKCECINPEWLLTGSGQMLKENAFGKVSVKPIASSRKTSDPIYESQRIPVFNLEATLGLIPTVENNGIDNEKIIDYLYLGMLPKCDGAITATGDSMYPLLKAGDIVAYKSVPVERECFFFGEMYLLSIYIDESTTIKTIKFVHPSDLGEDYIKIISHNPHHASRDIEIKKIAAMGLIRASIRIHN